ncbi:insulinase family protein [Bacillus sp. AGMB 02131]|uniref:Insulinase family protein n=1 Tax=Peribacillus faecalis TaxID=2772559 RepID=A0A927D0M7_9BACI|nr:pitrilysin family protein [Peribacillus faecalis]MBD3109375.1 insulinase family protein [Peribacillus faecalis]
MEAVTYKQIDEVLYYEKQKNGLDVYILPKKGFNKSFATFTTKYGSVDNWFIPLGKQEYDHVPDGIAHFLEHKMFEKEDGDVFQLFSKQGASANAFTSFTRTAYLFSCTSNFEQNLTTLIDFVQEPYFTEATVEKEKGIIGQEINMYDDNPDWRLYFGTIANMFHNHPVKIDIAGTIESIDKITKDMLYECYNTFYHPSNMLLFIVGAVDPEKTMELIRNNQNSKTYEEASEIKRKNDTEPNEVEKQKHVIHMNVSTPKVLVGIKPENKSLSGAELLKNELTVNLLLDILFGRSSDMYEHLYSTGLIDGTFSYDYTREENFGFAMIGGDSGKPDELADQIINYLLEKKEHDDITEETLMRTKKKKIGGFLRSLNSPEYIANSFTRYAFYKTSLFEIVPVLESITLEDIQKAASELISKERMTVCQVLPK